MATNTQSDEPIPLPEKGTSEGGGRKAEVSPRLAENFMITLQEMITCAVRELNLRKRVYPHWIPTKISSKKAAHEIDVMEAIVKKLKELEAKENPPLL